MIETSLQNHFLVAMPTLYDSFFHHSVVYICEHNEDGAMGLIINRPTQVMLAELLSHLSIDNHANSIKTTPVLFGGPVKKGQGMVLHNQATDWNSTIQVAESVFLTTSTDILKTLGTQHGPEQSLVALGYAGWEPGQLEQEITENSWLTVKADNQLLFEMPVDDRWEAAAKLLGVDINLMSNTVGHA